VVGHRCAQNPANRDEVSTGFGQNKVGNTSKEE
jgi:hypothetical protein